MLEGKLLHNICQHYERKSTSETGRSIISAIFSHLPGAPPGNLHTALANMASSSSSHSPYN
jgi:hypothetical protein